jgi:hypothetical protein
MLSCIRELHFIILITVCYKQVLIMIVNLEISNVFYLYLNDTLLGVWEKMVNDTEVLLNFS